MSGFNRETWNKRRKERESRGGGGGGGVDFAKPSKGVSYWKLLPRAGSSDPLYDPLLYFGYKKADGSFTVYKGLEKNCPLLSRYVKLKKAGKDKLADKYKPKRVYHYNAVNAKTGELVVLQVGQMVQDDIDEAFEDRPSTFNPFDPKNKYVVKIRRKGSSWNNTKYSASFVKVSSFELPEDVDLDNLPKLEDIHEEFTREELLALTKGEAPASKRKSKNKNDKAEKKEVEEEIEEEDIDDDIEEEVVNDDNVEEIEEEDDDEFAKAKAELEDEL